jgi:hypothetical protein
MAGALFDYVDRQAEAETISSVHLDRGYMLHTGYILTRILSLPVTILQRM